MAAAEESPDALEVLGYEYNGEGKLVQIETGRPFEWKDQKHYDQLADAVLEHVEGTLSMPRSAGGAGLLRMLVKLDEEGKPAETHFLQLERYGDRSLVEATPVTGRTHQIRVHFAWRKHPLVGDPVYGGRASRPAGASDRLLDELSAFNRQALHARELTFTHPESMERLTFSADIPSDLAALLTCLEAEDPA